MNRCLTLWRTWLVCLCIGLTGCLMSCSSDDEDTTDDEYQNWAERNAAYFASVRQTALDAMALAKQQYGDDWEAHCNWRAFLQNKADATSPNLKATDTLYVQILKRGTGSGYPYINDSIRTYFCGRMMPTDKYPDGRMFAHSGQSTKYEEIFSPTIGVPSTMQGTSFVKGFATALLYMRIGDFWRIYLPSELAYGKEGRDIIPGYSTLVFDVQLLAFFRSGAGVTPNP